MTAGRRPETRHLSLALGIAHAHDLGVHPNHLVRLPLLLAMALCGAAACSSSSNESPHPMPLSASSRLDLVAGPFRQPTSPGDAAAEYVTGLAASRHDLSDPLQCIGLDYGGLPVTFSTSPHHHRLIVKPSRVVPVGRSRWQVDLALVSRATGRQPYVTATVVKARNRYMVCRVH